MVCLRVQPSRGFSHHSSTKGVTTTAPTPSPSHHVLQMVPYFVHSANPDKASVVTPMVALKVVLTIPAKNANLNTSRALSTPGRASARAQPLRSKNPQNYLLTLDFTIISP